MDSEARQTVGEAIGAVALLVVFIIAAIYGPGLFPEAW